MEGSKNVYMVYDDGEDNEMGVRVACGCRETYYCCVEGVNGVVGFYEHAV